MIFVISIVVVVGGDIGSNGSGSGSGGGDGCDSCNSGCDCSGNSN